MRKKFTSPVIEVVKLDNRDVIVASNGKSNEQNRTERVLFGIGPK